MQVKRKCRLGDETFREKMIALMCGLGACIPITYGIGLQQWTGDRIMVIFLFVAIGFLSIWQDNGHDEKQRRNNSAKLQGDDCARRSIDQANLAGNALHGKRWN